MVLHVVRAADPDAGACDRAPDRRQLTITWGGGQEAELTARVMEQDKTVRSAAGCAGRKKEGRGVVKKIAKYSARPRR